MSPKRVQDTTFPISKDNWEKERLRQLPWELAAVSWTLAVMQTHVSVQSHLFSGEWATILSGHIFLAPIRQLLSQVLRIQNKGQDRCSWHKANNEGSSCVWERKIDSEQIVQLLSHVQRFATPRTVACLAPLSSTVSRSLLKFMSIESVMLSNHFIFCFPLLLLPSVFPTIRVFTSWLCKWVSSSHQVAKVLELQL